MVAFIVAFFVGLLALMTIFFTMALVVTAWPLLAIFSVWLLAREARLASGC